MINILKIVLVSMACFIAVSPADAKEDRGLQKQRQAAQKARQSEKREQNREIADATRSFREFTRDLKDETRASLKDIDTEFELRRLDLQAERDSRIAEAEAEYQKKWSSLFQRSAGGQINPEALKEIEREAKAYSDQLFRLREEAAQIAHKEKMVIERKKHALLQEMDRRAMDEAASLGLTKKPVPVLATPIGGELTRQEKQWNEREEKDVERTHEQNLRLVREFRTGEKLRAWELDNLEQDFQLASEERRELHAIESQHTFFNTLLMQSALGAEVNQQDIMARIAELAKQTKLVDIKYDTIRKKNAITRREEKKKLLEE
jgi:hypothetical protein